MATTKSTKKPKKTVDKSIHIPGEAGRPPFVVTEFQQKVVIEMAAHGIPQEQIAAVIGCSVDTLHKYFDADFKKGKAIANFEVSKALFNQATKNGSVDAMKFWMKTQAKWKETNVNEIQGKDGGAIEVKDVSDAKQRLLAGVKQIDEE